MSDLISAFNREFEKSNLDQIEVRNFWREVIDLFEQGDCDTLDECLGQDENFDRAFYFSNPRSHGFRVASQGGLLEDNPWGTAYPKKQQEWIDGFEDY